jgi:hypothetical protein
VTGTTAPGGIPVVAIIPGTEADAKKLSRASSLASILKPLDPKEFLRLIADILNTTVGGSSLLPLATRWSSSS